MTWGFVALAVVTAGSTVYSADSARKAQNNANDIAIANAKKNAQMQEEATNKANAKSPDLSAMLSATAQSARGGQSSTMLTGPSGIDPTQLTLGKNSLLGGAPAFGSKNSFFGG